METQTAGRSILDCQAISQSMEDLTLKFNMISQLATDLGLSLCGAARALPLELDRLRLGKWQESGFAAGMTYMQRDAALLSDVRTLNDHAKSVVSVGVFYQRSALPARPSGFARVARYAWGLDYHTVLRSRIDLLGAGLAREAGCSYRVVTDAAPLLERAWARQSSLGFIGKNTLLITPGSGSFSLLGELILDCEISDIPPAPQVRTHCGGCTRCIDACPTGAIVSDYSLDAARCISYLTIEKRGAFEAGESAALGEWIFGCDICQEVCPYNTSALRQQFGAGLSELGEQSGVGPLLELGQLLAIRSNSEFERRFGGTALLRPRRTGILRNACAVAANTQAKQLIPALEALRRLDSSATVRACAQHALSVLSVSCDN